MSWAYLFPGGSQGWVETRMIICCPYSEGPRAPPPGQGLPGPSRSLSDGTHSLPARPSLGPWRSRPGRGSLLWLLEILREIRRGPSITHYPACSNRKNPHFHPCHPLFLLLHGALLVTMVILVDDNILPSPSDTPVLLCRAFPWILTMRFVPTWEIHSVILTLQIRRCGEIKPFSQAHTATKWQIHLVLTIPSSCSYPPSWCRLNAQPLL